MAHNIHLWIISMYNKHASEAIEHASSDTLSLGGGKRPTSLSLSQRCRTSYDVTHVNCDVTHRVQQRPVIYHASTRRSQKLSHTIWTTSQCLLLAFCLAFCLKTMSDATQMRSLRKRRLFSLQTQHVFSIAIRDVIKFVYSVYRAWKRCLTSCQSFKTYMHSCLPALMFE